MTGTGNFQEPPHKAVDYSFNRGQANNISNEQPFATDGTGSENKIQKKQKCQ